MNSNTSSSLKFAGEVDLVKVDLVALNGIKVNIAAQIIAIEIYEDLFSPFISASIVLRESTDFINLFQFIGDEYVDMIIKTPGLDRAIEGRFYIYKITDRSHTAEREVVYTLKCISEEFLVDVNTKVVEPIAGNIADSALKIIKTNLGTQ